jgi:hypothetical protein
MYLGSRLHGILVLLASFGLLAGGCGKPGAPEKEDGGVKPGAAAAARGGKHGAWWCEEHGIPEAECSMCSAKVEKECKAKGDWCDKHNRALSQCFFCKPERRAYYAAKYKARYGKEPPPVEELDEKKDKGKGSE